MLRLCARAIAAGIHDAGPAQPRLADEPLPPDSEVDWDRAFELARDRRNAERDRLDRIESKIAPVIAGTLAALGLFVDKAAGPADLGFAALLLIPLAMLLFAFRSTNYKDIANLDVLVETYGRFPKTYIRSTVLGAADAIAKNAVIIDRKASDLNRAMLVLYSTVVLILIWHGDEAIYHERHAQTPGTTAATARSTARGSNAGSGPGQR